MSSDLVDTLYTGRWYIALLLVATYFVTDALRTRNRLAHVKGPWLAQWSILWVAGAVFRQKTHLEFYDLYKKYGPLVRIGPNTLLTANVEQFHRMGAPRSPYTRSAWYHGFRLAPGVDNVFSSTDEKWHAKRRAQMNMGYTGKENINPEPTVDKHVVKLISLIRSKYLSTDSEVKFMDLSEKCNFFTMDVITDIGTGKPFGDLDADKDLDDYLKIQGEAQPAYVLIGVLPSLTRLLQIPAIGNLIFPTGRDEFGMGKLINFTETQIAKRFSPENKIEKPDILQSFINHGLTEKDTVAESLLLTLGGTDTTATAIRSIMLHVMTSPLVYKRLQAEIDQATKDGKISRPVVRHDEARALPYLQAVILEGLRMHPPGAGLLSKVVPPEGDVINGVPVPGGTEIASNTWSVMRNEETFGAAPDMFRPERWLGISEEKYAEMARVVDLIFGHGKYKCLGMTIAKIELNKVPLELLQNFDFTVVNPTDPWKSVCAGIIIHKDFFVRVTERKRD